MSDLGQTRIPYGVIAEAERLTAENKRLRKALEDLVDRIEKWEEDVATVIGRKPGHGMDLRRARRALSESEER